MTKPVSSPSPSLLDAIVAKNAAASAASAGDVQAATKQYWAVVDKLAANDKSGGIDLASFEAILAVLGLTLENVRTDVASVQRVRTAQVDLDATNAARAKVVTVVADASAVCQQAKAALEAAELQARNANWRLSDLDTRTTELRLLIRDELSSLEAELRGRGFNGELLQPPAPKPPMRRWRFTRGPDASVYVGRHVADGSEVDMDASWSGIPANSFGQVLATCLGEVTDAMGPPIVIEVPRIGENGVLLNDSYTPPVELEVR